MTCVGIRETRDLLRQRQISVTDHVTAVLAAIDERDGALGAYVSVAGEAAVRAAEAADGEIAARGDAAWRDRPLLGLTVSVKDLVQTADLPTTRGSLLPNTRPRVDAPVVARLRRAGAIVVGKTTTSEYGWSASTVSRIAPPTRNPWAPDRSAGGSSGGAAAAVAAGLCDAAVGTDGAGSVRIPAAFCGVVGLKPTFGRVPYVPACPDRLAHVGPLTRTVADAAELAAVLAGPDGADPDSAVVPLVPAHPAVELRIGWLEFPGTSAAVRAGCDRARVALEALGHRVEPIELPFADPYPALLDLVGAAEAAGTDPADEERADPGRTAIVHYGRTLTGAAVLRAEGTRLALRIRLAAVLRTYDLLAMATVPIEPFGVGAIGPDWAADPRDLRWLAWSPAAYPFNLTGQPALSLPVGLTPAGLPVGLQLVGAVGADALVLAAGAVLEAALGQLPPAPSRTVERMR